MILDSIEANGAIRLHVLWSRDSASVDRSYRLDPAAAPITIGRRSDNVIAVNCDGVSRRHARLEHRVGGWWVVDEQSMNGTSVNGSQVTESRLAIGDRLILGGGIVFAVDGPDPRPIFDGQPTIMTTSPNDGLTGLPHRRSLVARLERELSHPRTSMATGLDRDVRSRSLQARERHVRIFRRRPRAAGDRVAAPRARKRGRLRGAVRR
jgi:predicted component of type VI protein secretion system